MPGGSETYSVFFGRNEIRRSLFVDSGHNYLPVLLAIGMMVRKNEQGHHFCTQLCKRVDKGMGIANAHKSDDALLT